MSIVVHGLVLALIPTKKPLEVSQANDPKVYLMCLCVYQVYINSLVDFFFYLKFKNGNA